MAPPRVLIRAPALADEAEWIARMRAGRRLHHPWIRMPLTPEAFRDHVARNADDRREQRIVCRVEDGAIVGFINVSESSAARSRAPSSATAGSPGSPAAAPCRTACSSPCAGLSERYLKVSGRWRDHERWAIRAEQRRATPRRGRSP